MHSRLRTCAHLALFSILLLTPVVGSVAHADGLPTPTDTSLLGESPTPTATSLPLAQTGQNQTPLIAGGMVLVVLGYGLLRSARKTR